jgi:hypothetical protein
MKKYPNINARAILKRHNRFRRGDRIPQEDPKTLGDAIDLIVLEHAEMEKALYEITKQTPATSIPSINMMHIAIECRRKIFARKGIK